MDSADGGTVLARGATADVIALDADRVAKRFHSGTSAAVARREAVSTRAARAAGLPVPVVHGVATVDGRPAIVLDRIDGPTMLARLSARPWRVRRDARRLATLHVSILAVGPAALPAVRDRLATNVDEAPGLSPAVREAVRSRLDDLPPGDALCHGDLHPGNVLLGPGGPTIVDWLDAGSGHPAADVARTSLLLRFGGHDEGRVAATLRRAFRRWYLRAVSDELALSRETVRAWELPVAAARVTEDVPEASRLRSFVAGRLDDA